MESAEEVVYSSSLVSPVREAGVDVDGLVRLPMVMSHCLKKDESVQVTLPRPECESLEKLSSENKVGDDFSFSGGYLTLANGEPAAL